MKPIKLNNRSRLASITHAETHTTDTYYASPGPLRSDPTTAASRRVWASRAIFVTFLLTVAGVLGYVSYHLLTDSEGRLAHGQFEGIAERALDAALATTLRRRLAAMSVATTVAHSFSDANIWPNASIPGFEAIASSVMTAAASNRTNFGVCTLVSPDQLAQFEDYFYNIAIGTINPNYPNTTGMRAFGGDEVLEKGIHGFDDKFQIYRETDGKVWWNSTYDVICPYTMHTAGHRILMYNAHSFEGLGRAIDEVISCANNRSKVTELNLNDCSIVTDMFQTYDGDGNSLGPNAFIVQPVYPANDPNALVAIGISGLIWAETLEDLFTADVNGVDLVLQTETQVNTYQIHGGVPSLLGEGDLHASKYSEHAISIDLYSPGLFSYTSAQYTLTIYPKDSFFEVYSTGNPQMATMVVVFSILFTALLFFTYDFFVRQEFHAKQAVLEAKRLYVRYVSHEVRTPLNTVCMGLTLLRDEISTSLKPLHLESKTEVEPLSMTKDGRDKAEATVQHLLSLTDEVLHNAEGAVDVLNDLLNYDKVERGKLSLELGIVRIWDLIAQAVNEFRVQAAAEKLHFVLDMGEIATDDTESHNKMIFAEGVEEKIVVGDPVKITQCVRNLVSNALKFTPEEGNLTIRGSWLKPPSSAPSDQMTKNFSLYNKEIVTLSPSGMMELSVSDSGAGMTETQLVELFQDGVQFNVNNLQSGQGSGLGLFITKGIVERHGGSLTVASEGLGKGTTFKLTLPLYQPPKCETSTTTSTDVPDPQRPNTGQVERRPQHILVADDCAVNRKLLIRLLTRAGHTCDGAEDGLVALHQVEAAMENGNYYDTILLDHEMPVLNGPTAAKEMRKLGFDALIVGVTGNLMREDVEYFKEYGANEVLPKPFKMKDLIRFWDENMG